MLRQIALIATIATSHLLAPAALAQEAQEIEPAWRVVTRDGVAARSGPESVFYSVAEYNRGRVLMVDALVGDQARVRYPDDLPALVPADEVRQINAQTVELTRASALRAPSVLLGLSGSWKGLYETDLPVGTRLTVRETITNDRGQTVGYRVDPPRPPQSAGHPHAFIAASALRDATSDEITAFLRQRGNPRAPETTDTPAARPAAPATNRPANQPANQPAGQPTDRPAQPTATPATQPATQPSSQPSNRPSSQPATGPDTSLLDPIVEPEPAPAETAPAQPAPVVRTSKLEDLEATLAASRRLPPAQLDDALDELLAEYTRTRAEAEGDERLAAQLDQRIEWLRLRIATRDQRRAIENALATADERSQALSAQVNDWRRGRAYELVGRLVQSTVYNGERLPRMYRVQAINAMDGTQRTLGYIVPDDSISAMLGKIVGISGEPRFDPQLRLVVIRPDQVDVMPE